MALSGYDSLVNDFKGFHEVYKEKYESYTSEDYDEKIDIEFQEHIKISMGEIAEQIKNKIMLSHIYRPHLEKEQILSGLDILKIFEEIHDKHREMLALSQQYKLKCDIDTIQDTVQEVKDLKEKVLITFTNLKATRKNITETTRDVNDIKANLFGIFSFMVGFLGFIFINFNIFSKLGDLSINKAISTVLLLNTSFVSGIVILMKLFRDMIFREQSIDTKFLIKFIAFYFFTNLTLLLVLSFLPTVSCWVYSWFL